jgi:predicted transposase/invertase (TIGR01784 family)
MSRSKYDAFYKEFFSQPQMVEDLLKNYVQEEWVNHLDFSTLKPFSSNFVSDSLKKRENDLILSVKCKDSDITAYIYLLFEFQSRIDHYMAIRMLVYVGLFYQELIKHKLVKSRQSLPPVFPLVVYNGIRPWNAAQEVSSLVYIPFVSLAAYVPNMRYFLFDISQVNAKDQQDLASFLVRLEKVRDVDDLRLILQELIQILQSPDYEHLRRRFTEFINHIVFHRVPHEQPISEFHDLKELNPMLAETVTKWTKQWKMEGRMEGRLEGTLEGRSAVLERLLRKRFGTIAPMYLERIRSASIEQLDLWAERILDAKSIQEIFSQ